jgi:regulator of protease activity HflC (stomatin/prohibitin superfamily)
VKAPDKWDYRGRPEEYEKALKQFNKYQKGKKMKNVIGVGGAVFGGLVALTVIGGSWYTVDQGERGVVLRNGAVIGTAEPGLGFKFPLVDSVVRVSTQDRTRVYRDVAAYSRDQQPAQLVVSISYRIPEGEVTTIYSRFGGEEGLVSRVLERRLNEIVRTVFGRYNAVEAVQQRERLGNDVRAAILVALADEPVIVTGIQIENIDFSDAYEQAIEARMLAEVEVERIRQTEEREAIQARIRVIQAQAEADSRVAQATAEAQAITLTGNAEAEAIRARGDALRENPSLVELVQAERWNGVLPTTMIPGQTVPFLNVARNQE